MVPGCLWLTSTLIRSGGGGHRDCPCVQKGRYFHLKGHSLNVSLQGSPEGKGAPRKVGGWGMGTVRDPDQTPRWLSQLNVPGFVCKITHGGKLLPGAPLTPYPAPSEPVLKSRPAGLTLPRTKGSAVQSPLVPPGECPQQRSLRATDPGVGEEGAGPLGTSLRV